MKFSIGVCGARQRRLLLTAVALLSILSVKSCTHMSEDASNGVSGDGWHVEIKDRDRSRSPNSDAESNDEFAEFDELDDLDEEPTSVHSKNDKQKSATGGRHADFSQNAKPIIDNQQQKLSSKVFAGAEGSNSRVEYTFAEDEGDSDFDHFQDSEEFEGLDSGNSGASSDRGPVLAVVADAAGQTSTGDLKIRAIPLHLRAASYQSYYVEMLLCAGLTIYFINFVTGRAKNSRLAHAWLESNRHLLEDNFALVGDDGLKEIQSSGLRKESENCFTLWCSGRQCVEGMLVELRLIKRQCLIGVLGQFMKPSSDQITFKVKLDSMDPFVFCFVAKKGAQKLTKDLTDVLTFCSDRRALPEKIAHDFNDGFVLHSEIPEVTQLLFQDVNIFGTLLGMKNCVELLHISDQYQAQRPPDDTAQGQALLQKPQTERVVILKALMPGRGQTSEHQIETLIELLRLVLYLADKIFRLRLTKEARLKAERNRQKVEETFLRSTHAQRQELAQQRREERIRAERERILAEDDPEKQRRLELREQKRLAKKSTPKLKQVKVRAV